jgi:transcriptional regulator with XRE-family HTH domain
MEISYKRNMKKIYNLIGEKIRKLRTAYGGRGISQEALAEVVGTTPNTISRWENATYKPSLSDLERLARFFGVPMSVYFPHKEPNESVQALLSATGALDKNDLEEVTRYAEYRKLRRELRKAKRGKPGR